MGVAEGVGVRGVAEAKSVVGVTLRVPDISVSYEVDGRDVVELLSPAYGTGSYNLGTKASLFAKVKGKFWLFDSEYQKTLFEIASGSFYPVGRSESDDSPDSQGNQIDSDVCTKDNPNGDENEDMQVSCKVEEKACPSDDTKKIKEYYRKTTYKWGATVKRSFIFDDKNPPGTTIALGLYAYTPLVDHVKGINVIIREQKTGEACERKTPGTSVGSATRSGWDNSKWNWEWTTFEPGYYKLAAYSKPSLLPFLNFAIGSSNTFNVYVGDACHGTGSEDDDKDDWVLSDTDDSACKDDDEQEPEQPEQACMPGDCKSMDRVHSDGDPHNLTFDGVTYDTMSLGEFVYVEEITNTNDITNSFELQVRQQRIPGSSSWVAYNTAVAMRAGGHIFDIRPLTTTDTITGTNLFIDGQLRYLEYGYHTIGNAVLRIEKGFYKTKILIWTTMTGTPPGAKLDDTNAVKLYVDKAKHFVYMRLYRAPGSQPPWRGMLGTPDGNKENDMADRQGRPITDVVKLADAWRITDRNESLFTYAPGEGPETFNLPQPEGPPTREWLLEHGYVLTATNMLKNDCNADMDKVDPNIIYDIAMDLAGGETVQDFLDRGICSDSRVDPPPIKVGFRFMGRVVLPDQTNVGVQGQEVVVYSGSQRLCSVSSRSDGWYSCVFQGNADDYTSTLPLRYAVWGTTVLSTTVTPPEPGSGIDVEHDLDAQVTSTPCNPTMTRGQAMACEISTAGEQDAYTFTGVANERILVRVADTSTSGDLHPQIRVVSADSTVVCNGSGNSLAEAYNCTLPEDGTYQVVVTDYYGESTGEYMLYLESFTTPSKSTPLERGTPIESAIMVGAEADFYTFTGVANERIFVRVKDTSASGDLHPWIWVLGTEGEILCSTSGSSLAEEYNCTLPQDGTYQVVVMDTYGAYTGSYTVYLEGLATPSNTTALERGTPIEGTIAVGIEADFYTFTGVANERIFVRVKDTSASGDQFPEIWVLGTEGEILCSDSGSSLAEEYNCTLPQDGTYQVVVMDTDGAYTGSYTVYLEGLATPSNTTALERGTPIEGTIAVGIEADFYTFTGVANERIFVRVKDTSASGDQFPEIWVLGTEGEILCSDSGSSLAEEYNCTLPQDGTYQVVVMDTDGAYTGSYTVYLESLTAPSSTTALERGTPLEGTIAAAAEADFYTFTGVANERIFVRVKDTSTSGDLYPEIWVLEPDGTILCSASDPYGHLAEEYTCTLPQDSTYQVVVMDRYGASTGSYTVYLESLTTPSNTTTLERGTPLESTISMGIEADFYTFTGVANERIFVRVKDTSTSGDLYPEIWVLGTEGEILCSDSGSSLAEEYNCTLPQDGTYQVVVTDYYGTNTGSYTVLVDNAATGRAVER